MNFIRKNALAYTFAFITAISLFVSCAKENTENVFSNNQNTNSAVKTQNTKILTIKDISNDPLSFEGEITITGVNAGIYPNNGSIFFVVDTAELLACKNLACGAFQLPVIYEGSDPIPEIADEINITGSWTEYEEDGEKITIFGITKIEVKRNIMSLLS